MTDLVPKLKRILIMAAAIVAMGLPLMFLMEDFVQEAIVKPLARQLWVIRVILEAMPQSYLIGALVALVLYVAVRSLGREPPPPPKERHTLSTPEGEAAAWFRRLDLSTKGGYSQRRIRQQVGQMILQVIAHEQRLPVRDAIREIELGNITVPEDITSFVDAASNQRLPQTPSLWQRLWAAIRGVGARQTTQTNVAADLDPALRYIEAQFKSQPAEEAND